MSSLAERLVARIGDATLAKSLKLGLPNFEANRPYFATNPQTIADLPPPADSNGAAIVIVGGPSLHRRNSIQRIAESGFRGTIIAADGSLGHCLRKGLVPQYVVTLDGHPTRIVRWYGDPELQKRPADDYFSRQDLDRSFWSDEDKANSDLIALVDRHGPSIKALLSTSSPPNVTARCIAAGMDLYWWNPIYDDYDDPASITRSLFARTGFPCLVSGGNVGTCAWVFAHAVLRQAHVAVVGMDFGYAPGTTLRNTQYFYELMELLGERVAEGYIEVYNPHLDETWFTDPTYYWYRQIFITLAAEADCRTYNCSEGGILFGDHISFMSLDDFLTRFVS